MENRFWYFYELWQQRHGQMEAAVRELSSAEHVPSRRVPSSATQHRAPRSGHTIPIPRSHWSEGQRHGLAWAAPTVGDSGLEWTGGVGKQGSPEAGSCQGCQQRCCRIALAWLGTGAELPVSHSSAPLSPASLPSQLP